MTSLYKWSSIFYSFSFISSVSSSTVLVLILFNSHFSTLSNSLWRYYFSSPFLFQFFKPVVQFFYFVHFLLRLRHWRLFFGALVRYSKFLHTNHISLLPSILSIYPIFLFLHLASASFQSVSYFTCTFTFSSFHTYIIFIVVFQYLLCGNWKLFIWNGNNLFIVIL